MLKDRPLRTPSNDYLSPLPGTSFPTSTSSSSTRLNLGLRQQRKEKKTQVPSTRLPLCFTPFQGSLTSLDVNSTPSTSIHLSRSTRPPSSTLSAVFCTTLDAPLVYEDHHGQWTHYRLVSRAAQTVSLHVQWDSIKADHTEPTDNLVANHSPPNPINLACLASSQVRLASSPFFHRRLTAC